jgi:hypothetical protein
MTTRRVRKTKLMRDVEERFQRPLERLLPELVNQYGLSQAATEIGVSTSTVSYWMLKLGVSYRRVALNVQETIEVKRPG